MNKTVATIKRNFTNPTYAIEYSLTVFIVSCTIFGSLMVYTGFRKIPVLNNQLSDLRQEVNNLEAQKYYRLDVSAEASKAENYYLDLYRSVPDSPEVDQFLTQVMPVFSESGFTVLQISSEEGSDAFTETYHIETIGNVAETPRFIKAVSEIDRLVKVRNINSNKSNVTFIIDAYHTLPETLDFTLQNNVKLDIESLKKEFEPVHERN